MSGVYTIQTSAFGEATGHVEAGEPPTRAQRGENQEPDLNTGFAPGTGRSGKPEKRAAHRPSKPHNYLGTKMSHATTIYNSEPIPRRTRNLPHKVAAQILDLGHEKGMITEHTTKNIDDLFETSEGRTLFKKIGDKLMTNAKGGKLREQVGHFSVP